MILWILWFIIGNAFVVAFSAFILPRLWLKAYAVSHPVKDRGLGKYNLKTGGVAILCEPSAAVKQYLKQYQICQLNSKRSKYFIGEWAQDKSAVVEYSIIAYNRQSEIIEMFRVQERTDRSRYTHRTELPEETDYVSVSLEQVNGSRFPAERSTGLRFFAWFSLFTLCLACVVDLLLWLYFTFISRCVGGFAAEGLALTTSAWILAVLTACIVVLPLIVLLARSLLRRLKPNAAPHSKREGADFTKFRHTLLKGWCAVQNFLLGVLWSKPVQALRRAGQRIFRKKVTPRPLTAQTGSETWIYDGNPHSFADFEIVSELGLVAGHTAVVASAREISEITDTATEVGYAENALKLAIYDEDGREVSGNYFITYLNGRLRIKSPVVIRVYSIQKYYDGTPLSFEEGDFTIEAQPPDVRVAFSLSGSLTAVGKLSFSELAYQIDIYDGDGNDVISENKYRIEGEKFVLEVKKRPIEVTTVSISRKNEGQPLYGNDVEGEAFWVSSGSLVAGHRLDVVVVGVLSPNEPEAANTVVLFRILDEQGRDVSEYYEMRLVEGVLQWI